MSVPWSTCLQTRICCLLTLALFITCPAYAQNSDAVDVTPLELDLGELDVEGELASPQPQPEPQPLPAPLGAVSVITSDQLASASSIAAVLDQLPGMDIKFSGGAGQLATAQLRGSRASQVTVLLDGMPLPALGVPDLALLPLGGVERVEVLRGPAGSAYGSGALGGVINIVTGSGGRLGRGHSAREESQAGSLRPISEEATLSTGSTGMASFGWSRYGHGADWHFSHLRARNNYSFTRSSGARGRRQNNAAALQQLWTGWQDEGWDWRAGVMRLERGVPGSAEFPTLEAQLRQGAVWLQAQRPGAQLGLSWTGARFRDPQPYLNTGALASDDQRWHFDYAGGRFAQEAGADWGWRLRADTASGDASGDTLRLRGGLDATRSWQGDLGGRAAWQVELGAVTSSDAGVDPVASICLSRDLGGDTTAYASAGYSVRHPDLAELYLPNMGGVRGNPELRPERAWSGELGLNYATRRSSAQAAAFWTQYADSILFLPVSAYAVEASNTGRASVAGLEAAWRHELGGGWSMDSAGTWLHVAEMRGGTPLAQRSPLRLSAGLAYRAAEWRCGLRADYAARTPVDLFGNLRTAPRTVLDFELTRTVDDGELSLAVTNLTNISARDSWNYPLPGREINLTWRSKL